VQVQHKDMVERLTEAVVAERG